eukprot:2179577-Pyramimonas_sp.AAC.1
MKFYYLGGWDVTATDVCTWLQQLLGQSVQVVRIPLFGDDGERTLLAQKSIDVIVDDMCQGRVLAIVLAPLLASWTQFDGQPGVSRPRRSVDHPWGLPQLGEDARRTVLIENNYLRSSWRLLEAASFTG